MPPGYSLVTSLLIKLTGWHEAGRIVSFISMISVLIIVFDIARTLYPRKSIHPYVVIFLLVISPLYLMLSTSINQESLALLLAALAVWLYVKSHDKEHEKFYIAGAGLLIGLATFAKQPGFFAIIPIAGSLIYRRRAKVLKDGSFLILFLLPIAVVAIWLFWLSLGFDEIASVPNSNSLYSRSIFGVPRELAKVGFFEIVRRFSRKFILRLPASLGILVLLGLRRISMDRDHIPLLWFFGGLSYYFIFLQGGLIHDHYLTATLPGAACLAALGVHNLFRDLSRRMEMPIARILVLCLLLSLAITSLAYLGLSNYRFVDRERASVDMTDEINRIATTNDVIWYTDPAYYFQTFFIPNRTIFKKFSDAKVYAKDPPATLMVINHRATEEIACEPKAEYVLYRNDFLCLISLPGPSIHQ